MLLYSELFASCSTSIWFKAFSHTGISSCCSTKTGPGKSLSLLIFPEMMIQSFINESETACGSFFYTLQILKCFVHSYLSLLLLLSELD